MDVRANTREKRADDIVHIVGMTGGVVAAALLLGWAAMALPASAAVAVAIYCGGLVAMLCCSGAYHLMSGSAWKGVLRRLDHAAIFIKIAGTYTPFALVKLGGTAGLTLFAAVWAVALLGAVAKLVFATQWDRLSIAVYLALGWSGVMTLQPLADAVSPASLVLLGVGGILYSVGVLFFLWRDLPYQNAIWHLFVLLGTSAHFGAVATAVAS